MIPSPIPRPLVVGPPRSGFTLLISILLRLADCSPSRIGALPGVLDLIIHEIGRRPMDSCLDALTESGLQGRVISNTAFESLLGGPIEVDPARPDRFQCRKYLGVLGAGDATFLTSHPMELLFTFRVVNSHESPAFWARSPIFSGFPKFASLRNPAGVLVSAVHSLNALASTYIQRFIPDSETELFHIRRELALSKLSDPAVFTGLAQHLRSYLTEFISVRDSFQLMRWEDLLTTPIPVIMELAHAGGLDIPEELAASIWNALGSTNLTGTHRHNFFQGKVGFWRQCLTNEHIEMLDELGFQDLMSELDYPPLATMPTDRYSPMQRELAGLLRQGKLHQADLDSDLVTFAFNKSNLRIDRPGFKSYPWRKHSRIERSSMAEEAPVLAGWDALESGCADVNAVLGEVLSLDWSRPDSAVEDMTSLHSSLLAAVRASDRWPDLCLKAQDIVRQNGSRLQPLLLMSRDGYNLVACGGRVLAIPHCLGPLDLDAMDASRLEGVLTGDDLAQALAQLERSLVKDAAPPILIASEEGINIVSFAGRYLAIPQALGPMDLVSQDVSVLPGVITASSLESLRAALVHGRNRLT